MVCAQYLLAGIDWDSETLGYWIDHEVAPGGYAWVFPKGDGRANVGLGIQADMADESALAHLQRFINREPRLARGSPVTLVVGSVPVSVPCRPLISQGLMLVGDAGRQVDPLTGGGIVNAMTAGWLAAHAAARAIEAPGAEARVLADYEAEFRRVIGRKLERNYRFCERFPPKQRTSQRFVGLFALAAGGK
jgi:digeranylgeranylglycerophospholipid reductase